MGPDNNGTFIYPIHGPVEWRASVKAKQANPCGGGTLSVGGLGVDGQGAGCAYSSQPYLEFGCAGPGSYWAIEGKWEFSNDQNTVLATWSGRSSTNDGFNED